MAFLEINNPSGTAGLKRPFRISDLQDLWSGITSLFAPIKNEQFRIISGFNLTTTSPTTYTSGAVFHNGHIYEYNASRSPITTTTQTVYFAILAIDPRQFEDGNSYPFAYKFVCGGSSFDSEDGYVTQSTSSSFRANITRYKTYVGRNSITSEMLADKAVTRTALADNAKSFVVSQQNRIVNPITSASSGLSLQALISSALQRSDLTVQSIRVTSGNSALYINTDIDTATVQNVASREFPLLIVNNSATELTVSSDNTNGIIAFTFTIPANKSMVVKFIPCLFDGFYLLIPSNIPCNANIFV